ncbi:MAG: exodeoxyribonuclease-5 [Granulosicoccus sp.]|jgi:exodeoxyribonuclease-5
MNELDVFNRLNHHLPFEPTTGQQGFLYGISDFISSKEMGRIYMLRGYAGTGKTSMVISLVETLKELNRKYVLLAPTGRAAKVISQYTGQKAFTIHRMIYQIRVDDSGRVHFGVRPNTSSNSVIVVDEASMIQGIATEIKLFGHGRGLLSDLMQFVEDGINCKLILIGDTAQLPPVHMSVSPALDPKHLTANFDFNNDQQFELTEVVRQAEDSGILEIATYLRSLIKDEESLFQLDTGFPDVQSIDGYDVEECLDDAYSKFGDEGVMVVTRSNKSANMFNQQIRAKIKWQEEELDAGDKLMIVKNNYTWLPKDSKAGFIANGEMAELLKVVRSEEKFGLRFADVVIRLLDHAEESELEVKIILDTLHSETTSLDEESAENLYNGVRMEHSRIPAKNERFKAIKEDQYLHALQVKFGYAVTCHKAQGGQWPAVFIDQGYMTEEMLGPDHLRWLYTAVTRASEQLYLVNFAPQFIKE